MDFLMLINKAITPPSLDGFSGGLLIENIGSFFSFIFTFFGNIVSAITNFYDTLVEINTYVIELGDSAQSGVTSGLPVLESVGLYRYLMGDPVFYMTYILVLAGCLFTIYKLILLFVKTFKEMKENITSGGKTKSALVGILGKLFG